MTPTAFISKYSPVALAATKGTNIFPSVQMAQAILESGWGTSRMTQYNNIFNIKTHGWKGESYCFTTDEFIDGVQDWGNHCFRVYNSTVDSFKDHIKFLKENPRYTKNGVFSANTPEAQAWALQKAGFATHPQYAELLIEVINKYDLKKLDQQQASKKKFPVMGIVLIVAIVALNIYYWSDLKSFVNRKLLNR